MRPVSNRSSSFWKPSSGQAGSVLVEASVSVLVCISSIFLALELVRRAKIEAVLHHSVFLSVRAEVWGMSRDKARSLQRSFCASAGWCDFEYLGTESVKNGFEAKVYARFPLFLRLDGILLSRSTQATQKHHYEVTRKCHLPTQ